MHATETARHWIAQLNLQPHPEGGFYKEVYRSQDQVTRSGEARTLQACTSIYYLLEGEDFSGFHRIVSDELWYFHAGEQLTIHVITANGEHEAHGLSKSPTGSLSLVVPGGLWFAAELPAKTGYALVSCAVAPGFQFSEFEMGSKKMLETTYPQHADLFKRLCRC